MARAVDDGSDLARQVEDLRGQQRAISGVLRAVARSVGLQPVLDEVIEAATRLCAGGYGALYLLEGELLHGASQSGNLTAWEYDTRNPIRIDRTTVVGRTALAWEPAHIPDILEDPEYAYAGPRTGFRAMLGVPILVEHDPIGVLAITRSVPEPFSEDEIELVKTFADQAAIAIANARLLEAVERQRTELARFVSPQVADIISSQEGRAAARRAPRVHLLPVLRPARLHCLRRDSCARGALRGAARVPRHTRRADPGPRGHAGAFCGRWADGLLQRPSRLSKSTSFRRSGSR